MPPILLILFWFLVLAVALVILLKSAEYFVFIAELLGKKFKVPPFIIGATVVAFGTSLPELAVGISSILQDQPEIITGTVVGSNISNIFFITGIAIIISSGFFIHFKEHRIEFLLLIFSTLLGSYFLMDKAINIFEAIICLVLLAIYLVYVVGFTKNKPEENTPSEVFLNWEKYTLFGLSVFGVWLGAKYTIDAITSISSIMKLGNDVISQTVVALGTSLPELAVTAAAVRSKQFGIVLGNVIGSNIFNLLAVLAIPALVGAFSNHPFLIQDESLNVFGIPMMLLATGLLLLTSLFKKMPRSIGVLFLLLYLFFMVGSFMKINLKTLLEQLI
jgi:cation:H+ antiporter